MPDPTLLLLLDEVRGKTVRVLETIAAEDSAWAPPGLQNTILWHAGHSYFLLEWLTTKGLGQSGACPPAGMKCLAGTACPAKSPPTVGRRCPR